MAADDTYGMHHYICTGINGYLFFPILWEQVDKYGIANVSPIP